MLGRELNSHALAGILHPIVRAGGENRTLTALRPSVFETDAYTYSATPAPRECRVMSVE